MLVAVWERRAEIGLRRALGASHRAIAGLFLAEAALVGALGGMGGAVAGLFAGYGLAVVRDWEFTLPAIALGAPVAGLVVGMIAGVHPAVRAARADPAVCLRA